jgi:hypothetical protein
MRVGNGLDADTDMGPLIDKAAVARVDRMVEEALAYATPVVRGGVPADVALAAGAFYRPALLEVEDVTTSIMDSPSLHTSSVSAPSSSVAGRPRELLDRGPIRAARVLGGGSSRARGFRMARPGLEPGTPRFSAACPTQANVVDLQRNRERASRRCVRDDSRTLGAIAVVSGTRSRTCA